MTIFPVERVRSQFPASSAPSVFLDNPAGAQVPRQVTTRPRRHYDTAAEVDRIAHTWEALLQSRA